MGLINRQHNAQQGESTARFFNFDCIDDVGVARALVGAIEEWAKSHKMDRVIGPFGFSDKDPQGLQTEGFEHLPVIAAPSNPSYLPRLLETQSYTALFDCVSYRLPIPPQLPELYERIHRRIVRGGRATILEFKKKRDLKPFIVPTFRLVNETYADLFGFLPMSEKEMQSLAAQYLPVIDPEFVKLARNREGNLVAFIVGIPDMSAGIQRAKGSLWPFGFLYLLAAAKRTTQLNLMLGAIRQDFRGTGVNVLLGKALFASARARGFTHLDSHLVLESNRLMCSEYENLGGEVYKRFRVFQKSLADGHR